MGERAIGIPWSCHREPPRNAILPRREPDPGCTERTVNRGFRTVCRRSPDWTQNEQFGNNFNSVPRGNIPPTELKSFTWIDFNSASLVKVKLNWSNCFDKCFTYRKGDISFYVGIFKQGIMSTEWKLIY
ncbi:uncharacterized protein LOC143146778 [Ptiloglossa arizonensis]|uniref:uncharacterized protein LOC143146778 n=1 Tax=Ptiloglossa arizonensis TaxID=3350558 RepID=UPI003F9F7DD5